MSLRDRLEPAKFVGDVELEVVAVEADALAGPIPGESWRYVPEQLWTRLLLLGAAYQLHFAEVVDRQSDTILDPAQCEWLCEELFFLREVVSDRAAHTAIQTITDQALMVLRRPSMRLVLSPP